MKINKLTGITCNMDIHLQKNDFNQIVIKNTL